MQVSCAFGVLEICFKLHLAKQAIVLLIKNGKIIFLNFSYSSYSCTVFILSYLLFHTLEGMVRKMAID